MKDSNNIAARGSDLDGDGRLDVLEVGGRKYVAEPNAGQDNGQSKRTLFYQCDFHNGYGASCYQNDKRHSEELSVSDNFLDVTKSVAGVVASDLYNVAARVGNVAVRAGKTAGRAAFKTIAYPICGNLSANLQTKLEDLVGKENYNAENATNVSFLLMLLMRAVLPSGQQTGKLDSFN